ncbi:MAG: peptide-methionine (R)-S-oxide reductase MsrB [Hyphomicrobiaceae bacterium]
MNRRNLLIGGAAAAVAGWHFWRTPAEAGSKGKFEITKTDDEWRKTLTKEQFYVLRKHGTERAFTHPLNDNKREGTYHCAGCDLPLYSSKTKYDSRTGWPSFWAAIDNAVGTTTDYFIGYPRTEVHCRRCGGHLGHIFNDGPPPTGKRHCINGVSLKFVTA